ncbi:oxidoreductase [Nannizzia gypsea CBS 118893]|uniref:Oxidoreductase n=1 Tax=Arthroderma gypseum (strain ATCC MYA-4604 / CBS 118893) TaxID=535722 RepID=E4UUF2_ARTGP|nr:oxidoreductase [Nannizzia gypsea CBS 118893]EFR00919.1 oxidoreductase [Nannizzia gypsea CBS 118893]
MFWTKILAGPLLLLIGFSQASGNREPFVAYISSFVSKEETDALLKASEHNYEPSGVYNAGGSGVNEKERLSEVAYPGDVSAVQCIGRRALAFQGWSPYINIERLQVQRYKTNGFFKYHYDSFGEGMSGDRVSTFNIFLHANCTGGGTHFPNLRMPDDPRWCEFIECGLDGSRAGRTGITFKPISGNAVFWENIRPNGERYLETLHAGLEIESGTKIGLNIWSWYGIGLSEARL